MGIRAKAQTVLPPPRWNPQDSGQFFKASFEASTDTCAAARRNQVPARIQYFKLNGIGEVVGAPV
jgi:hypothetical protein